MIKKIIFWISWCIKDLWGTKVMYFYVVKLAVFRVQRGSAKSPLAPSNFSSLWLMQWNKYLEHSFLFFSFCSIFYFRPALENVKNCKHAFNANNFNLVLWWTKLTNMEILPVTVVNSKWKRLKRLIPTKNAHLAWADFKIKVKE